MVFQGYRLPPKNQKIWEDNIILQNEIQNLDILANQLQPEIKTTPQEVLIMDELNKMIDENTKLSLPIISKPIVETISNFIAKTPDEVTADLKAVEDAIKRANEKNLMGDEDTVSILNELNKYRYERFLIEENLFNKQKELEKLSLEEAKKYRNIRLNEEIRINKELKKKEQENILNNLKKLDEKEMKKIQFFGRKQMEQNIDIIEKKQQEKEKQLEISKMNELKRMQEEVKKQEEQQKKEAPYGYTKYGRVKKKPGRAAKLTKERVAEFEKKYVTPVTPKSTASNAPTSPLSSVETGFYGVGISMDQNNTKGVCNNNGNANFGKYHISIPALRKNNLIIYRCNTNSTLLNHKNMSPSLLKIVMDIKKTMPHKFQMEDYNKLNENEKKVVEHIINILRLPIPDDMNRVLSTENYNLKSKYEILIGELSAGNYSKEIKKEIKDVLNKMKKNKIINSTKYNRLIKTLDSLE